MANRFFEGWANRRRNPFTDAETPVDKNETGLIIPSSAPYIVQLLEIPKKEVPTSVTVYNVTTSSYMTEVSTTPGLGQFRVDYAPPDGEGTGLIEFNSGNAGQTINVSYKATGSPVIAEFLDAIVAWVEAYEAPIISKGIQASNNTKNSNDAGKQTLSTSAVKLKEIKINQSYSGSLRVFWQMRSSNAEGVWSQVYKNGVAIGTAKYTESLTFVDFTQDITGGLAANDLIQIYAWSSVDTTICYVQNMRLQFDWAILKIYNEELAIGLGLTDTDALDATNQDPT